MNIIVCNVNGKVNDVHLSEVYYSPELDFNILSEDRITSFGFKIYIEHDYAEFFKQGESIMTAERFNRAKYTSFLSRKSFVDSSMQEICRILPSNTKIENSENMICSVGAKDGNIQISR
jgi:hypothetical protein